MKKVLINETKVRAIMLSREKGAELARTNPQIWKEWRDGGTEDELGLKYYPEGSVSVARNAIHYALKSLASKKARMSVARKHILLGSAKAGEIAKKRYEREGNPLEKMSRRKRFKASQKGGRIAGKKMGIVII